MTTLASVNGLNSHVQDFDCERTPSNDSFALLEIRLQYSSQASQVGHQKIVPAKSALQKCR
jgi:hypothetical protein